MKLFETSNQWQHRPIDETFWGLTDALEAARSMKLAARVATVPFGSLRVEADEGDLRLVGKTGVPAFPTHSAARQLCARAQVPHSLIRRQPATLAAQNLNWGLKEYQDNPEDKAVLLFHSNGRLNLRAMTTEVYERFWNQDFMGFLQGNLDPCWRVPPAKPSPSRREDPRIRKAQLTDLMPCSSVVIGQDIGPAGIYMSDADLFLFMVSDKTIQGPNGQALYRFFYAWNNEIGTGSWGICTGYFDKVCQNHIIWGASGVHEIRIRHVGEKSAVEGMGKVRVSLSQYSDEAASDSEAKLLRAASVEIAGTKQEVVEKVMEFARRKRINELSGVRVEAAYDLAEQVGRYGSPRTPWALTCGLTELAQATPFADERIAADRAAARVLELAF